jgi:hypothetical protein
MMTLDSVFIAMQQDDHTFFSTRRLAVGKVFLVTYHGLLIDIALDIDKHNTF